MGRGGRGGGGLRGGGMRLGGGSSRGGTVRGLGSSGLGSAGRGGRGAIPTPGRSGGLGNVGRGTPAPAPRPTPAPRPAARPASGLGRAGSFAAGVGVGSMMGGGRRRRGWGGGWGWGRRRHMPMGGMGMGGPMMGGPMMGRRRGGCGGGCMTILLIVVVLIIVMSVISWANNTAAPQNWGTAQQTDPFPGVIPSTVVRTPLPAGSATETGPMFTDHLNWIGNQSQLVAGMNNFHRATGVRPHLYLIGEIYGTQTPSNDQLMSFATSRYNDLFNDEAHVLVLFFENDNMDYGMVVIPGNQARSVLDQEAQDILLDFIGRYYYMDISEEELFSSAFNSAAERIMHVPPEPPDNRSVWMTIIIVAGVLLLVLMLFRWWQRKQEQKNLEAEQTERILSQPLETLGSGSDAANLAQQYMDDNNNNS